MKEHEGVVQKNQVGEYGTPVPPCLSWIPNSEAL